MYVCMYVYMYVYIHIYIYIYSRTRFLRAILSKGLITAETLRRFVEAIENMGQQHEGARLVARAWVDAEFKKRLMQDGNRAAAEIGIDAV